MLSRMDELYMIWNLPYDSLTLVQIVLENGFNNMVFGFG